MFNLSDNVVIIVVSVVAIAIILWGYNRAKPYGEIGILAWLQSLALMTPWLVFFALLTLGIYVNLIGVIFLLVLSAGTYIYLGTLIRNKAKEQIKSNIDNIFKANLNSESDSDNNDKKETEDQEKNNLSLEKQEDEDVKESNFTPVKLAQLEPEFNPIQEEDLKEIKTIFGIDTFFAIDTIPYQEGVIFKGNLRGEAEYSHRHLTEKLTEKFGDKYRLFLVETPEEKPVVIILPSANDPKPLTLAQKNLALVLFLATIFTSMEAIALLLGFDLVGSWDRYPEVLPLTGGLWFILLAHEIAHRIIAERNKVKVSLPFFLPSLQIGSFGAITRFESLIPNRSVLFDVAFAGPAASFVVSLGILLLGFILSAPNSSFEIPTSFFRGSILVGGLAKLFFQSGLEADTIGVHPFTILGWLGLVITAINLLPAGQLDGGRIIQAIYGRKTCRRTTVGTLIILGIVSIFNPVNSLPFYWAIIILFLQRDLERPSLNELTEPDDSRAGWGLFLIFLSLTTLIPITPSLASRLGIGLL
ncbi:site-2 protease family protein [Cyanobacterium aponinum]|uniref:Peptidase M50 n=1 Tax=Cyanobacterium aponinum (strain PCC 10605) TaxID=755178 RepID=K9YZY9_CYAAP|nr:site-2 protease family protein [Cyanobacterium aponinum]AFZ52521.1 peptidase M50 [Cyanobacterium aponinum PCC 10605]